MTMPDPSERKFFVVRLDLATDGTVSRITPIDAHTGTEIDPQDSSTWMTSDEAITLAKAWCLQSEQSSLVTYAATSLRRVAAVPAPPILTADGPPQPSQAPTRHRAPATPDMPLMAARSFVDVLFATSGSQEIFHWQSVFMIYQNGIYVEMSEDDLRSRAWKFFEHATAGVPLKSKQVIEVIKALEGLTYLPEKTPVPCWLDAPTKELPDLLICQNGAFDLATGERYAPTPRLFATIRLPVSYDPKAPTPTEWLKFLRSLWPNDPESIDTLQEIFGLMLTPITKFQKIFLLVGPKRSGKGTILRTLRKLLGDDNVAAPALSTLPNQYGMQCLIGKLAALIGDARINARSSEMSIVVERLLSLSGEDSPNIERKYLSDWTGRLPTRIVMSSNELPHLDNPSGAMASRFVILVLCESFLGREDLELESRLGGEMPAILNWAIEGRRRLLERGRFIQPASGAASVEQMAELSSAVAKFVKECCTVGPEHQVLKDDLYKAWRTWCGTNGEKVTESGVFGRDLIAAYSNVKPTKAPINPTGKRPPMYSGIALTAAPPVPTAATIEPAAPVLNPKVQEFARQSTAVSLPPGCTPVLG